MGNYPRHVVTRRVLVEVGQGVVIGIEQVRCDIGSITTSKNREVDHRERWSNVQTRGDSRWFLLSAQGFLYFERSLRVCPEEQLKFLIIRLPTFC